MFTIYRSHPQGPAFICLENTNVLVLGVRMIRYPWYLMNFDLPGGTLKRI